MVLGIWWNTSHIAGRLANEKGCPSTIIPARPRSSHQERKVAPGAINGGRSGTTISPESRRRGLRLGGTVTPGRRIASASKSASDIVEGGLNLGIA